MKAKMCYVCVCENEWVQVEGKPHHCPGCGTEDPVMICDQYEEYDHNPNRYHKSAFLILLLLAAPLFSAPIPKYKEKVSQQVVPGIWKVYWSDTCWITLFDVDDRYEAWRILDGKKTSIYKGTWSWDSGKRTLKIKEAPEFSDGTLGEYREYEGTFDANLEWVSGVKWLINKPKPDF